MKTISVPFLHPAPAFENLLTSPLWQNVAIHEIACLNWPQFNYKPKVNFSIACTPDGIILKFFVEEEGTLAQVITNNDKVYNDSCVEFFVSIPGDEAYYNFEFNCIGTLLLGYGASRSNRQAGPQEALKSIFRQSTLGSKAITCSMGEVSWELVVAIPYSAFFMHRIQTFRAETLRVNFYKCGNEMPQPHYLSWSPINTPQPDFHRSECFGELLVGE